MKKNTFFIFLFSVWTFSILFISCNNVDLINFSKDIKFDESLVLPIGETNLTVKDIFSRFGVPNDVDTINNEVYFQWSVKDEMSYNSLNFADSILPFNQTIFPTPFPFTYPANTPIILPSYYGQFDLSVNNTGNNDRVDSMYVNSSIVNVKVDVSPDIAAQIQAKDLSVEFEFDDSKLHMNNGIKPIYTPKSFGQYGQIFIGSYELKLIGSSIIPFKINFYVKNQLLPITLIPSSSIILNMNFTNVDFSIAYGFFHLIANESNSIKIPIKVEDYLPDAFLRFADPVINVTASTNVGAVIDVKVDYLKVYNDANPTNFTYAWFNKHTTNSINESLIGPLIPGNWSDTKINQFDNKNGEIDHFFDNKPYPNMLSYKFSTSSNPGRTFNFLTSNNKLKINFKASLPLKLKGGSYYNFTDTIHNLDLSNLLENVDSAILVLNLKNGLPTNAKYRMTYWKSTLPNDTVSAIGGIISTINDNSPGNLTSIYSINSPKVDSVGNVTEITPQSIKIILNKNQIIALKQTKYIVYSISFGDDQKLNAMHFTTKNSFGAKLGIFIRGNKITNLNK